jgi:flagellin
VQNLKSAVVNVRAAESTIRDADMAEEMATYTKNSILKQAAEAMLSQANQSSQGVLGLLR